MLISVIYRYYELNLYAYARLTVLCVYVICGSSIRQLFLIILLVLQA